jgi:transposase
MSPSDPPTCVQLPLPPLPVGEFAALIGLDWGDQKHAIAMLPRGTTQVEDTVLEHRPETVHAWLDELAARFQGQPVAVAVEASKGAIVAALLEHPWIVIYPIHPATSRRFSTAFTPSGAKDDQPDARVLLDLIVYHRARLRAMAPQEPPTRRVALLVEARRKLVDHRTMVSNQVTSLLKNYYPQALELIGDSIYAPIALAFLERWPELATLQKARPQTLRDFYYGHRVRRPELVEKRIELITKMRALTADRVLCEVGMLQLRALIEQIRTLNKHVAKLEDTLTEAFQAHPDAVIFRNLPGAGKAMAPRLCVLFGLDRQRWQNPTEMQKYYGVAPVIEKSGKQRFVHWRWSAPVFARQTLVEWAGLSVKACAWAKAYYLQQKKENKGHSSILRALAFKWLRILWRCWQDRTTYDDARYLAQLHKKNAPFLSFLTAETP